MIADAAVDRSRLLAPTHVFSSGRDKLSASRTGGGSELFDVPARITIDYVDRNRDAHTLTRATFLHDVKHGFPKSGDLHPEVTVTSAVGSSKVGGMNVQLASRR